MEDDEADRSGNEQYPTDTKGALFRTAGERARSDEYRDDLYERSCWEHLQRAERRIGRAKFAKSVGDHDRIEDELADALNYMIIALDELTDSD